MGDIIDRARGRRSEGKKVENRPQLSSLPVGRTGLVGGCAKLKIGITGKWKRCRQILASRYDADTITAKETKMIKKEETIQ